MKMSIKFITIMIFIFIIYSCSNTSNNSSTSNNSNMAIDSVIVSNSDILSKLSGEWDGIGQVYSNIGWDTWRTYGDEDDVLSVLLQGVKNCNLKFLKNNRVKISYVNYISGGNSTGKNGGSYWDRSKAHDESNSLIMDYNLIGDTLLLDNENNAWAKQFTPEDCKYHNYNYNVRFHSKYLVKFNNDTLNLKLSLNDEELKTRKLRCQNVEYNNIEADEICYKAIFEYKFYKIEFQ